MSLRLRILIGVIALSIAAFTLLGDGFFVGLGLPSGSGRIVVAGVLLIVGIVWFVLSSRSVQRNSRNAAGKGRQE